MDLVVPAAAPPVTTMDDAIARMEAIDARLPEEDGLACFNRMYLDVTRLVAKDVGQNFFADPNFLTRLDVVFANLYFDAVNALATSPTQLPPAWAPLLQARGDAAIEPIQFALAGMNAHINHDLPVAVVSTCAALGGGPGVGSRHADYLQVDVLLDTAEQSVRQSFESGIVLVADRHARAVANLVANWSVNAARDTAWDTSLALWAVREVGLARNTLLGTLARTVAMGSRLLLAAV